MLCKRPPGLLGALPVRPWEVETKGIGTDSCCKTSGRVMAYRPIMGGNFAAFARHWKGDGENHWLGDLLTEAQKCVVVEHCIAIDGLEHTLGLPPPNACPRTTARLARCGSVTRPQGDCVRASSHLRVTG